MSIVRWNLRPVKIGVDFPVLPKVAVAKGLFVAKVGPGEDRLHR